MGLIYSYYNVPEAFREDVQTLITANSTTEGAVE